MSGICGRKQIKTMKIKDLQKELTMLLSEGKGNYDVMIKVGDKERDLITNIGTIKSFPDVEKRLGRDHYPIGYIELESCNNLNWR